MKKTFLLISSIPAMVFFFNSCSQDIDAIETQPEVPVVTRASYSDNMLSFASVEEMEQTIYELLFMDEAELESWYLSRDSEFVSQQSVYSNAIDELEEIDTIEEAEIFKDKYRDIFIWNDDPRYDELYNPYLPSEDLLGYSYVINPAGNVLINGEINNFNIHKEVQTTEFFAKFTRDEILSESDILTRASTKEVEEDKVNYIKIRVGAKKFMAEPVRQTPNTYVWLKLSAHKHSVLGWNKYQTNYYLQDGGADGGFKTNDMKADIRSAGGLLKTRKVASGTLFPMGSTGTLPSTGYPYGRVNWKIIIYSDGTGSTGAHTLRVDY